jgi:N-glycosidase YbiA
MQVINSFFGEYRFLSNFWPCDVHYLGVRYPSVENAYVAAKTLDPEQRKPLETCSPGEAKRFGRKLLLRSDWEDIKLLTMELLLFEKFKDPILMEKLLDTTGITLVEGNTWGDRFWGVCNGAGENHLGKLLMKVRDYYND